jgi:hypothetical protein
MTRTAATRSPSDSQSELRKHISALLTWNEAHVDFDAAVKGVPSRLRGVRPQTLPYSLWQLLEHLRLAQRDILDFCIDPSYRAPKWPDDYWPKSPMPPDPKSWQQSVAAFRADRSNLKRLVADPSIDLYAEVPRGKGQTYLRELLLVADHGAFHVGEIVLVRRLLGIWQ